MMKTMTITTYRKLPKVYDESHTISFRLMPNEDILKKTSEICEKQIVALSKKKIEKACFPKEIYRIVHPLKEDLLRKQVGIAYTQDYHPKMKELPYLSTVEKNYSDREILEFFLSLLKTLKEIHQNQVISGDITYSNIIMGQDLDYRFIDFEFAFVDSLPGLIKDCSDDIPFPSDWNKETLFYHYSEKEAFRYLDKANLINMMCYFLKFGTIPEKRIYSSFNDFDTLELPSAINTEFEKILMMKGIINREDYPIEEVETLIQKGYKLPYRKRKK